MFDWTIWLRFGIAVAIAIAVAGVVILVSALIVSVASRRREWGSVLTSRSRHPYRLLIAAIAVWVAVSATLPDREAAPTVDHVFLIIVITLGTWFVASLVSFGIGLAMGRYRIDIPDNLLRRRLRTQLIVVRRLASVVIVIVGAASILLTFPGVQAVGASVLASAGVLSVVAGIAAQSTLANIFAGVQLAFNDGLRVDDVVVVQEEWGRIEEITLTYVVVHIWDDRRLVLPTTYFTTTPFENWTRNSSELLGAVEFDLDWRVSPSRMREELDDILTRTKLWDGRTSVLQVTDAIGGMVHVRILVTAVDSPTLFDLRCFVRESMVEWLQSKNPEGLPRTRVQLVEQEAGPREQANPSTDQVGLFTGTPDGEERAKEFTSAIPIVKQDRALERAGE